MVEDDGLIHLDDLFQLMNRPEGERWLMWKLLLEHGRITFPCRHCACHVPALCFVQCPHQGFVIHTGTCSEGDPFRPIGVLVESDLDVFDLSGVLLPTVIAELGQSQDFETLVNINEPICII